MTALKSAFKLLPRMSEHELAQHWNKSVRTLQRWRTVGWGRASRAASDRRGKHRAEPLEQAALLAGAAARPDLSVLPTPEALNLKAPPSREP